MDSIYLDNAATTPLDPEVVAAMLPWLEGDFGNPSSRHRLGLRAAQAIDAARLSVARAAGARRADVIFTSGGTEANNLAVLGAARARIKHGKHVLIGATEHPCVRESALALRAEGFTVDTMPLDEHGALDLEAAAARMRGDTVLVAQMLVQNECGSVYPVRELAKLARQRAPNAHVHVDAAQALGKLEIAIGDLGVDSVAISAHKVHGPKGSGALVLNGDKPLAPLFHGGGQEGGRRSGTENVAGIVGLGVAARLAHERTAATASATSSARTAFLRGLERIPDVRPFEPGARSQPMSPAILALILERLPSEVAMHHLEERGVIVSAGSACHSKTSALSPSLAALGLTADEGRRLLRVSFSRTTTATNVEDALTVLESVCRTLSPAAK
jgi:cysteine desulfurase